MVRKMRWHTEQFGPIKWHQAGLSEERSRVVSHEKREWVTKDSFQGGSHGRGRNTAGSRNLIAVHGSEGRKEQSNVCNWVLLCVWQGSLTVWRILIQTLYNSCVLGLYSYSRVLDLLDQHASVLPCRWKANAAIQSINCWFYLEWQLVVWTCRSCFSWHMQLETKK